MWGKFSKHWQIIAAVLFSVVIIVGAYLFARGFESPTVAQASTETALLQAIATKDSDGDGLPDWEEALYGTDSHVVDTFKLGMTDGEAVAKGLIVPKAVATVPVATSTPTGSTDGLPAAPAEGSLTAMFAQNFFTLYVAAKQANGGANLSESQMGDIATQAVSSLSPSVTVAPPFKTLGELTISGSGPEALKAFAASAEAIFLKNTSDAKKTDLDYFKGALLDGDTSAFAHILSMAKMYRSAAMGLAVLPVPKELAEDDLLLINTLMHLSELDVGFTRSDTDPLVAIIALQQYPQAAQDLGKAFINIGNIYATSGVILPPGTPGASLVNMVADITASQQAAGKKL